MQTLRAFIAMPLEGTVFDRIVNLQRELATRLPTVRWVSPETLHLTLAFLGNIPEESLEKIGTSMLSIGDIFAPAEVRIGGLGAFPDLKRPRVVWLGLQGDEALRNLHTAVTGMLSRLQMPPDDKPFRPHLTLGRCRQPDPTIGRQLAPFLDRQCGQLRLTRLILYESRLTPRGAIHLPRRETPLRG